MDYPTLPVPDGRQSDETLSEYAARLLRFVLAEDVTATLDDEQLALADMAAQRAVSSVRGDDGLASRVDGSAAALQTLTNLRHTIALILRFRSKQELAHEPLQEMRFELASYPTGGNQDGRLAPLDPAPINRPPGGAYATRQADLIPF